MKNPLEVTCPKCSAAVGGKCLEKTLWGSSYIDEFHAERIDKANASVESLEKPVLSKSMYP